MLYNKGNLIVLQGCLDISNNISNMKKNPEINNH